MAPATESVTPKSVAPFFKGSTSREAGSSAKGFANPRCIDTCFLQGVKRWKFDDHNSLVEQQFSSIPVSSEGKIVAFDWHQVTDTYRASRFKAFRADWDTAELPQSVIDIYQQTAHSCGQFDKVIILSHIERSEKNREFLLKSTQVNRLPVSSVFVTETRTGAGGKAAVLQALLGERNIARSLLPDDNVHVCSEIKKGRWHTFENQNSAKGALFGTYSLEHG